MALEIGREMAREMALETAPEKTLDMASELALYTIAAKIISHLFLFHWHLLSYITSQSAHHFATAAAVPLARNMRSHLFVMLFNFIDWVI